MRLRAFIMIVFLLFVRMACYSQAIYDSIPGAVFLTNDSLQDKIGIYNLGNGFSGVLLNLDSGMHFSTKGYSCIDRGEVLDTGTWCLYKGGRIGLSSKRGLQTFDLIRYSHFYFCVASNKREKFFDDLSRSQLQLNKTKPIQIASSIYTANDLVAFSLMERYYFRDLGRHAL